MPPRQPDVTFPSLDSSNRRVDDGASSNQPHRTTACPPPRPLHRSWFPSSSLHSTKNGSCPACSLTLRDSGSATSTWWWRTRTRATGPGRLLGISAAPWSTAATLGLDATRGHGHRAARCCCSWTRTCASDPDSSGMRRTSSSGAGSGRPVAPMTPTAPTTAAVSCSGATTALLRRSAVPAPAVRGRLHPDLPGPLRANRRLRRGAAGRGGPRSRPKGGRVRPIPDPADGTPGALDASDALRRHPPIRHQGRLHGGVPDAPSPHQPRLDPQQRVLGSPEPCPEASRLAFYRAFSSIRLSRATKPAGSASGEPSSRRACSSSRREASATAASSERPASFTTIG